MMLVLLAGLQSIPQELYESVQVDGASPWQSFWSITLPLLKFTMVVGVMIRLIDLTKLFGLIFVLTFGGPGGATETVAFNTYLVGFKDFRMSYAAALSYVIVGGVLVLTLLFQVVQRLAGGAGGMSTLVSATPAVAVRRINRHRARRWLADVLTYLGLAVTLVFFLRAVLLDPDDLTEGQRMTSSPFRRCGSPATPRWRTTPGCSREPADARYFTEQPDDLLLEHGGGPAGQPAHRVRHRPLALRRERVRYVPARAADAPGHRADHPVYLMYKALGLTNSYFGLVILYTVVYIPFAVWLLVGFLRDFPVEIEEAAMIDGCSRAGARWCGWWCRSSRRGWRWWRCSRSSPPGTSSSSRWC